MGDKQSKRQKHKYVSLRKALHDLRVNEDEFNKIIDKGYIKPVYEGEEAKFDEEEVFRVSRQMKFSPDSGFMIEDEDLYKSTEVGMYESLFLSGSQESSRISGTPAFQNFPREHFGREPEVLEMSEKREHPSGQEPPKGSPENFPGDRENASKEKEGASTSASASEIPRFPELQMSREVVKEADMGAVEGNEVFVPSPTARTRRDWKMRVPKVGWAIFPLSPQATVWLGVCVWLILSAFQWFWLSPRSDANHPKARLSGLEHRDFQPVVSMPGVVVSPRPTAVCARLSGVVSEVRVREGSWVKAREVIAKIESPESEFALELARRSLLKARLDLNENLLLWHLAKKNSPAEEQKFASDLRQTMARLEQQEPENFESRRKFFENALKSMSADQIKLYRTELQYHSSVEEVAMAEEACRRSQEEKEYREVRSPCDGIVIRLEASPGMVVALGSLLAQVADPSAKELEVRSMEIRGFAENMEIAMRCGDRIVSGKIQEIASSASLPQRVRCTLAESADIPFGLRASVSFLFPLRKNALLVPKNSIVFSGESRSPHVFCAVPENGSRSRIYPVAVKLGMSDETHWEVLEGLIGEELVVVDCDLGMRGLRDRMVVIPEPAGSLGVE